jgi:ABC-type antimicrobial peptide transport system permease subunit
LIGTFAVGTGFLLAFWANSKMSDSLSVSSVLAFNTQDLTKRFTLVGFELKDIGYLVGLTIVAGLVSAVLPLLSNLKRSPVQDMRDEN